MRISGVLEIPAVRVLLHLHERGEARYSELLDLLGSRGTLGLSLRDLEAEGLIERRVVESRPVRVYYRLTERGRRAAKHLAGLKQILKA